MATTFETGFTVPESYIDEAQSKAIYLGPGADPHICRVEENGDIRFYLTYIDSQCNIQIQVSNTVEGLTNPQERYYLLRHPKRDVNQWAPELFFDERTDRWYVYAAKSARYIPDEYVPSHEFRRQRMYVAQSKTCKLSDGFLPFYKIGTKESPWAIDGSVFYYNNNLYMIDSEWITEGQVGAQFLRIHEMENPWTIKRSGPIISEPVLEWETKGLPINEGPQPYIREGRLEVIYSASGSWLMDYRLGQLVCIGDPMAKSSWIKNSLPIRNRDDGGGHGMIFQGEDEKYWIIFHIKTCPYGWNDRQIVMLPLTKENAPNLDSGLIH